MISTTFMFICFTEDYYTLKLNYQVVGVVSAVTPKDPPHLDSTVINWFRNVQNPTGNWQKISHIPAEIAFWRDNFLRYNSIQFNKTVYLSLRLSVWPHLYSVPQYSEYIWQLNTCSCAVQQSVCDAIAISERTRDCLTTSAQQHYLGTTWCYFSEAPYLAATWRWCCVNCQLVRVVINNDYQLDFQASMSINS